MTNKEHSPKEEEPVRLLQRAGTEKLIVQRPKVRESKTETNLAQVISTHASTSQASGSDSDSSVFSFSVATPIIGYSGDSEWMVDTGAIYHVCPNRD